MNSKCIYVILLTVTFQCSIVEAQDINRTFDPEKTLFTQGDVLVPMNNGQWLIGGSTQLQVSNYEEHHPYIAMISETGELIWEHIFFQPYHGGVSANIHQIIPLDNGTFQVLGRFGPEFFATTYDTLGQQIEMHRYNGPRSTAMPLPIGDVLFSSKGGKNLTRTSLDGERIWRIDLSDYWAEFRFVQFCVSDEGAVFVLGEQKLFKLDVQNGTLIEQLDVQNVQSISLLSDANIIAVLTGDHVLRLDEELHLLDTVPIGKVGYLHYKMKVQNDRIFIFAKAEEGTTIVDVFDFGLDSLQSIEVANEYQIVQDIGWQNGHLLILGNKVFEPIYETDIAQYFHNSKFRLITSMYVQSLGTSPQFYPNNLDIALLDIELITPIEIPDWQYPCANSQLDSVRLWISNQGEDMIKTLTIGWKEKSCYTGYHESFSISFSNLDLDAGAAKDLDIGVFTDLGGLVNNAAELCFFVMEVNGRVDKQPVNDVYCKWLSNSQLTPLDDPTEGELDVSTREIIIFPNPVQSTLIIPGNQKVRAANLAQIFDASGKLIKEYDLTSGIEKWEIDVQNFNPGIYLLRVGDMMGRFVKH